MHTSIHTHTKPHQALNQIVLNKNRSTVPYRVCRATKLSSKNWSF